MFDKYDRIETDNALLDEVVYNLKILISSTILFNENDANKLETEESVYNSDRYIAIKNDSIRFYMFDDYEYIDFVNIGVLSNNIIAKYMDDYDNIPDNIKGSLLKARCKRFLKSYEETNNYYRNIMGLPDYGKPGIYVDDKYKDTLINYDIDYTKYVHEMDKDEINILKSTKVLDKIIAENPKEFYLKNIDKDIDYFRLRTAENYDLIYTNDTDTESTISSKFKTAIGKNRLYIIRTLMDDSYRMYNNYYDRFLIMIIIIQSACDVINNIPSMYINKEIFDIRTCQYFLESNGIPFFPEIPLKYQIKLVKNINNLIKNKGTDQNMLDICALFGFDNIKMYNYYLNKFRNKDEKTASGYSETGDIMRDFDLRFIKVPLGDEIDNHIKNSRNYISYPFLTGFDPYWNGPYDSVTVKKKILEQDFNVTKSKFISTDTIYSLTELTFQVCYFINMLLYNKVNFDNVKINLPALNCTSKIVDVFAYLYSLMYLYNGVNADIVDEQSFALHVKGFNFDADLEKISEYIANKKLDPNKFGFKNFAIPKNGVFSISELKRIFINNKDIYDFVEKNMYKAKTKDEYDCFKMIYESLFITNINTKTFYIDELGRVANSYTEYLKYKDPILYNDVMECQALLPTDSDDRATMEKAINTRITNTVNILTNLLDIDQLKYVFDKISVDKMNIIMEYINKIIKFFKSYTIALSTLQNVFYLEEDHVFIIDKIEQIMRTFHKKEFLKLYDKISAMEINTTKITKYNFNDSIKILVSIFKYLHFDCDINYIKDKLILLSKLTKDEYYTIEDMMKIVGRTYETIYKDTNIILDDIGKIIIDFTKSCTINYHDMIKITHFILKNIELKNSYFIKDNISDIIPTLYKEDDIIIKDIMKIVSRKLEIKFNINNIILDIIGNINCSYIKSERIDIHDNIYLVSS